MSREQRRVERKSQARGGNSTLARKTTPVRAGGGGVPWLPIVIAAGVLAVVGLLAYLIISSNSGGSNTSAAQRAADDSSSSIPGTYVPAPDPPNDRQHLPYTYSIASQRTPIPFCPGVKWSGAPDGEPAAGGSTPAASAATSTPVPGDAAGATPTVSSDVASGACRNSNPPSSGKHYNVQGHVDVGNGNQINIPADISVYDDPSVEIPRDSIPHILEHAGVFVGWNCADGDQACLDVVKQLEDLVNDRIDNNHNRVVMAHDSDLVQGTIGMSSWTRVLTLNYQDYDKNTVSRFIGTNSCRVDWEGFCK